MDPRTTLGALAGTGAWEQRPDGWWLAEPGRSPRALAEALAAQEARLITITAIPAAGGEFTLAYHWDLGGTLATTVTGTAEGATESIVAIFPCADWIEREIHDYMGIAFAGRDQAPLVLRPGDTPGFFVGREKGAAE